MHLKFQAVGASIAALLFASTSTIALAQDQAVILTDYMSAAQGLSDRLVAAGYTVTITTNPADLANNLNANKQVWDVRISGAVSDADGQRYTSYLQNAGGLFLLGENSSFATRNNSIVSYIVGAGGGNIVYGGTTVFAENVTDGFNGAATVVPNSATSFYVPASGTFSSAGNGTFITTAGPGGTGNGTGIAFGAGTLTNAPQGRLLTYLDVNTFQAQFYDATPALRALVDRMIGFVAGNFQVSAPGPAVVDGSQPSFNLDDPAATGNTITFAGGMLDLSGGSDPAHMVAADISIGQAGAFINTASASSTLSGTIAGVGGMVVSGQGTLTLTGVNSYAGGTIVTDSSVVRIGSADALGTGGLVLMGGAVEATAALHLTAPITLMSGLNVISTGSSTVTAAGDITGPGGFVKLGSGTLVLSGANTYTGGTTVAAGTLVGDSASLSGNIANAGTVEFAQATDGDYTGALSGTGALVKSGSGTLALSGANSYTGGTTVAAGTLVGDSASLGGNIANAGTVEFAQATDGGYAGALSGTGGLVKSGSGTLALSGANSYTGGTTVAAGTLVGDSASLGGNIANAGTVEFAQATDGTYAGALSGTGALVKSGNGTLVLSGANSYTGGTTVAAGTLVASTATLGGNVSNSSIIVLDQVADGQFSGAISGPGSFVKQGDGRLNLTGSSSYSGTTTIDAGRLSVNGSIANSGVIVQAGGSVGGNGVIGGLIVRTNATAAPGNSIGQLQAATTVLFEAGSVYQVEANAGGASDKIVATGTATLQGGTVQVLAAAGTYGPQTRYTILTAAQVNGQFATATSNLAFLMPTLSYQPTSVTLTLTRNDVRFADVAQTANQRAAANSINASFAPSSQLYYAIVGESAQTARAAFDHLSGEVHPSALSIAAEDADALRTTLLARFSAPVSARPTLWGDMAGAWTKLDGNRNAAPVSGNARSIRGGLELGQGATRFGVAGGYTDGTLHIAPRSARADLTGVHGALYAGTSLGKLGMRAGVSYSDLDIKTDRTAVAGALSQRLKAGYGGHVVQAFGEAGVTMKAGAGSFAPFVGVNALWLKNNAFRETGGDLALQGKAAMRDRAWSTAGVKARIAVGSDTPISIDVKTGWQHALTTRSVTSTVAFSGGPAFTVEGAPLARDAATFDAGVTWALSKTIGLGVHYDGILADQSETHAVKAALAIRF